MNEVQVFAGTTTHTVRLPDPHLIAPGTRFTIEVGEWECVHEGKHAFWEVAWEAPFTITIEPPGTDQPTAVL